MIIAASVEQNFYSCGVVVWPEYSSQLPAEGGGFYTFDTMDSSRPHYRKAWASMLYAVSLWLKETGFTSVDKDNSRPANMKADESDVNRFNLLIGTNFHLILYYLILL